ncbi:MAG: tetratricopeptide repeat protein [Saprospiraceae bacterium]|nr:tetratricopeptide repeat protein [Saprospiraceae bacterium]
MSRRKSRSKKQDESLVDIVEVRDSAQDFFDKNQNLIVGVMAGVIIVIGGYLAYVNFIQKPKIIEAEQQIVQAQNQFEKDSFALALSNPGGGYDGFLGIIDNYSGTPSANLSKYYAGLCYLYLGDYNSAIDYLEDFDADGLSLPLLKYGAIGDAYSELEQSEKAMEYYRKAVEAGENEFLSAFYLKKLAEYNEHLGNTEQALALYKELKLKYPTSPDARNIELYISRLQ